MKRITVTLNDDTTEFLNLKKAQRLIEDAKDVSYTKLINRAIIIWMFHCDACGKRIKEYNPEVGNTCPDCLKGKLMGNQDKPL